MNRGKHKQSLDRNVPNIFYTAQTHKIDRNGVQNPFIGWLVQNYVSQGFCISPLGRAGNIVKGHVLMFFILPTSITIAWRTAGKLPESQLSTNYFSIPVIPLVVTDGSPLAIMVNLHSPFKALLPPNYTQWGTYTCASGKGKRAHQNKTETKHMQQFRVQNHSLSRGALGMLSYHILPSRPP